MTAPRRLRLVLTLVAAGIALAAVMTVLRLRTVQCALRSKLPAKDSTTQWFLECDDGAELAVKLPDTRDGQAELRFERGPEGLRLPALKSALSVSIAGSRTTPFLLDALEVVEGPLGIGSCDQDRFREKARFLPRPADEALEPAERALKVDWSTALWACQLEVGLPALRRVGALEVSRESVRSLEATQLERIGKLELKSEGLQRLSLPRLTHLDELWLSRGDFDQCTADALTAALVPGGASSIHTRFSPCNRGRTPQEARDALAAEEAARRAAGTPCPTGMALIPGGLFSADGGLEQRVADFCLDVTEVTVSDYVKGGGVLRGPPAEEGILDQCSASIQLEPHRPVGCVRFSEAEASCARRGHRLLSAQEWRWAARGGAQAWTYPWGNEPPRHRACFDRRLGVQWIRMPHESQDADACPVGSFPQGRNPQGVYDLIGNVAEWVTTGRPDDKLALGGHFRWSREELLEEALVRDDSFLSMYGFRCAAAPASP